MVCDKQASGNVKPCCLYDPDISDKQNFTKATIIKKNYATWDYVNILLKGVKIKQYPNMLTL